MRRRLPIGIQNFRQLREEGYYYADKTPQIRRLIEGGKHCFLSRPRRFGKSLLLDTIKELFEGSEELFRNLDLHSRHDWTRRHTVVRLDFGAGDFTGAAPRDALELDVIDQLEVLAAKHVIEIGAPSASRRFARLLAALHEQTGERVVVLVDEYDKPILDALTTPEKARANRDFLRGLYGTLKSCDAHIRFSLLTGVTKFSRVNLFSGLNNLLDITLDTRYATICGYTETDLDTVFAAEMEGLDRKQVRDWYNGYSWDGRERVYNPFDILLLFEHRDYRAWWFETGTPGFLVDTLLKRGVNSFELQGMEADDNLLSSFDVDEVAVEALLFQTGYLTVESCSRIPGAALYRLDYPNREVRDSLNKALLGKLAGPAATGAHIGARLRKMFLAHDLSGVETELRSLFAGIPGDWHRKNDIARFEGYYASVIFACLMPLGMELRVEDASAGGRLDLSLRCGDHIYLFEFKIAERSGEGAALTQLRQRGYAEKYRASAESIHLIGIEFSEESRNIRAFTTAEA